VYKAGEVDLNVTEDDLTRNLTANDIMDKNPPLIYKNMALPEIVRIFSQTDNLYYPVVDAQKRLLGIITVDNIKNTLMESSLSDLLVADDLMDSVVTAVSAESSLLQIKKELASFNLEYLPVVDNQNRMVGFIERRMLYKIISTKVMELQKKADSLG
jgi:CIC family chloride channel protein